MLSFSVFIVTVLVANVSAGDSKSIEFEDGFDVWSVLRQETIFDEPKGVIKLGPDYLSFICVIAPYNFTDVFRPLETMISVRVVTIEDCTLPVTPLADVLQAINVNVSAIEILRLSMFYIVKPIPKGDYMTGLSIKSLWIIAARLRTENVLLNNPDFTKPLTNLTTLIVWGTEIPTISDTTRIKTLSLRNNAIVKSWLPFCEHLEELDVYNLLKSDLPDDWWPNGCSQLTTLRLTQKISLAVDQLIYIGIHKSCKKLQNLYMTSCRRTELPYEILNVATDLVHLNMSDNKLEDGAFSKFPLMRNLTHLDLSRNQLTGWALFDLVKQLPSLRYLNLDGNRFVNLFCNFQPKLSDFASQVNALESLSLRNMPTNVDCLKNVEFPNLKHLDLQSSGDNIKNFRFQDLPQTNATELQVDLRGRHIYHMDFGQSHYKLLRERNFSAFWGTKEKNDATKVTLLLSKIDCDCQNYWLARTLRDMPDLLSLPGLRCLHSGNEIIEEPLENMNCSKLNREKGCIVRRFKTDEEEIFETVECHGGRSSLDLYPDSNSDVFKTIGLNISNDHVTSLKNINITKWLKWIDLRNNKISRLDADEVSRLFANPERRVWLSKNSIICDCKNQPLLDALHEHRKQVVDFKDIRCLDQRYPLSYVTSSRVCHPKDAIFFGGLLLVLLLMAAVFLWCYREQVKTYLYSRGWCLACLRKDDEELDKTYDAFLFYDQEDTDFVINEFLPKLESKPNSYRVCVSCRDWELGEWIPEAVKRSVKESRRTIVILSKNLLKSMDSSEFRLAVTEAVNQSSNRLVVVLLDDVSSESLYTDLRAQLPKTYLKYKDPSFWGKLRYMMPHKRFPETHVVSSTLAEDKVTVTKI